jgi:streptogramin lyase
MRATKYLAIVPVVAAIVLAGTIGSPAKVRPCAVEYFKGITGQPEHVVLGPDGNLYSGEEFQSKILQFNPNTHAAREFKVPIAPHDVTIGPDGRVWFVSYLQSKFAALDPKTGISTVYHGLTPGSQPHMSRWDRGRLYITEQGAGQLAIFDPKTQKVVQGTFGLPPGNFIHNIVVLPNGDIWAVLQIGNALARFNFAKQRFDKFVPIPIAQSGPRDITYVKSRNAIFATLFAANELAEYDLNTNKLILHKTHLPAITYAQAISRAPLGKLTFVRADAKEQYLWIATLSGGELIRYSLATGQQTRVGCGLKLPSGPLGIANDAQGRLWVAITFPKGAMVNIKGP